LPKITVINNSAIDLNQACVVHVDGCAIYIVVDVTCGIQIDVCCVNTASCGSDLGPPCNSCDQVHYMPRG
jgi:hypothetical protein